MGRHLDQWLAANFSSAINQMSALGVKRTSITGPVMSAFDPKRTLDEPAARLAAGYFGASGLTRLVDHPNEGQLAILMCVVDAIADDENVGYGETDEIRVNCNLAAARFVDKRTGKDT